MSIPHIPADVDVTLAGPVRGGIPEGPSFFNAEYHLVHWRGPAGGVTGVVGLPVTTDPARVTCAACRRGIEVP